jgi:cell shape-determining protein MreD
VKWSVFILATLVALPMDAAFMPVFAVGGAVPSLAGMLAAFVSLHALRRSAWWGCFLLGLLVDLSSPQLVAGELLFLPGPNALGFALGSAAVTLLRGVLLRRSMLTVAAMTFVLLLAASLVWVFLWSVRGIWPDGAVPFVGGATAELGKRLGWCLWSMALALPVGWALNRSHAWWGFPGVGPRRYAA